MYLLTTYWRNAPNIENMRAFETLNEAYAYWKQIRIATSLPGLPWWKQGTRSCRAWVVTNNKSPKLVSKLFEEMVKRDHED